MREVADVGELLRRFAASLRPSQGATTSLATVLGVFLATQYLGAGCFSAPLEAAKIGLLPLLAMLAAVGAASVWLYRRVADRLANVVDASAGGADALSHAVASETGPSGTVLSWCGVGIYCITAGITYASLGLTGLQVIAREAMATSAPWVWTVGALLALVAGAVFVPTGSVGTRRLLILGSIWSFGVVVLLVLEEVGVTWADHKGTGGWQAVLVGLVTFVAGALVVASSRGGTSNKPGSRRMSSLAVLQPEHRTAVVGLGVQLALMLAILVIGVASRAGSGPIFDLDAAWVADGFKVTDLLGPLGVVIFSLVATGLVCLSGYQAMADAKFRTTVVSRSIGIVLTVLVLWMVPAVLILSHGGLTDLSKLNSNSAMGLAPLLGAVATLIAVTSATATFEASLSRESLGALRALRPRSPASPTWDCSPRC